MMSPPTGNRDSSDPPPVASADSPASTLPSPQAGTSHAKRGGTAPPAQTRAYPLLLLLSTAMAVVFCYMYVTKPEFQLAVPLGGTPLPAPDKPLIPPENPATALPLTAADKPASPPSAAVPEPGTPPLASMLPNPQRLPGDTETPVATKPPQGTDPRPALPGNTPAPTFEETNLHIQHVLTATTPGGDVSRIVLNVPVLYQSRNLAWTDNEVAESRELLKRLAAYQENSRTLREEGSHILDAWNHLIERSIPTPVLRADSPSLPANQHHAKRSEQAAGLDTTQSIQIQPADK